MEYWEFLLQKKGDRSWLPLESSDVEILEGRYRIVARSSRKDTPVEIQIRHTSPEDVPPRWRTKNRSGHTNNSGLVSIVPFVHLRPGMWELRCTNDLMSDFVGERWLYSVKLQVVAQEDLVDDDWSGPVVDLSSSEPDASVDAADLNAVNAAIANDLTHASSTANNQPDLADISASGREDQATGVSPHAETVDIHELNADQPADAVASQLAQESLTETRFDNGDLELETASAELTQVQSEQADSALDLSIPEPATASSSEETDAADVTGATGFAAEDDWDGAVPSSETTMPHDSLPLSADWRSLAEQMSQDVVDEAFLDVESVIDPQRDVAQDSGANQDRILPSGSTGAFTLADQAVQLQLQTDAYIVKGSRSVQLTGAIALALSDQTAVATDAPQLPDSVLTIRLFDPQTAQTVDQVQQAIPAQPLPAAFQVAIAPPAHRSHLILGEVILSTELGGQLLVTEPKAFSITTDLNELLDAIANQDAFAAEEAADSIELFNFDAPPIVVTAPLTTAADEIAAEAVSGETGYNADGSEAATQETAAAKPKIEFQPPQAVPFQPSLFQPKLGMSLPPQIRASSSSPDHPNQLEAQSVPPTEPASQPVQPASAPSSARLEPLLPKLPVLRPTQTEAATQANLDAVHGDETEHQTATSADLPPEAVDSMDAVQVDAPRVGNLHGEAAIAVDGLADGLADHEPLAVDNLDSTTAGVDLDPRLHEPVPAALCGSDQAQSADEPLTATPELGETLEDQQTEAPIYADAVGEDPWNLDLDDDSEAEDSASHDADLDDLDVGTPVDEAAVEPAFEFDITATATPTNPLEQSFSSLNLQDRFFSRLAALAFDAQAAQMQQIEDSTAYRPHGVDFDALSEFQSFSSDTVGQPNGNDDSASLPPESLLPDFDPSPSAEELAREAALTAHEVVIYDDEIVVDNVQADRVALSGSPVANANPVSDAAPAPDAIEPDIESDIDSWSNLPPLPVPQLKIPAGDLKAGEVLDVQVRLPAYPLRVYVKFWMSDRQMRTILDGPRWLADLEPDHQGYLETVVPLVVPKGCLEVQIEAVTVEVATQRQSQKASFNRAVLPMDLPTVSFDEFDLT